MTLERKKEKLNKLAQSTTSKYFKEAFDAIETDDDWEELYEDQFYDESSDFCPVCQFKALEKNDVKRYLMKKYGMTNEKILSELKAQFSDYDQFEDYLKGKL